LVEGKSYCFGQLEKSQNRLLGDNGGRADRWWQQKSNDSLILLKLRAHKSSGRQRIQNTEHRKNTAKIKWEKKKKSTMASKDEMGLRGEEVEFGGGCGMRTIRCFRMRPRVSARMRA